MEDECESELQISFAKLDIECDRKLDAWRGKMLTQRARAAKRLGTIASRRASLKRELVALDHERHALNAKVSTLKTQTSKKALSRMRKALAVECAARKDAAKEEFMQRRMRVVIEHYEGVGRGGESAEEDEEKEERSDDDSDSRVAPQRQQRGSRRSGVAHGFVGTPSNTASDGEMLPRSVDESDGGDEASAGAPDGVFSGDVDADEETLLGEEEEEEEDEADAEAGREEEDEGQRLDGSDGDLEEGESDDALDASALSSSDYGLEDSVGGDDTTVEDSAVAFSSSGEEAAVASENDVDDDDDVSLSEEGMRDEKQLEETEEEEEEESKRSVDAFVARFARSSVPSRRARALKTPTGSRARARGRSKPAQRRSAKSTRIPSPFADSRHRNYYIHGWRCVHAFCVRLYVLRLCL